MDESVHRRAGNCECARNPLRRPQPQYSGSLVFPSAEPQALSLGVGLLWSTTHQQEKDSTSSLKLSARLSLLARSRVD